MLLGFLGADAEYRASQGGLSILRFRLACSESYKATDGSRKERTEWVSCVMFGKRAEALAKYLTKGTRVFVEGALRTSSYNDRDGNKRYRTEVVANNIILCGGGSRGGHAQGQSPEDDGRGFNQEDYDIGDDQIPF